ncbi:MAG TPA: DUF1549 domain-containing protein, partial [Thermoanaerobaculia bacterium]|nr:DUF1549 domain-containing protein [Thermoanaerobaculia bacterium]
MRQKRALAGALLLLALGAARAGEEAETAPRAECTYDPAQVHSTREVAHLLSMNAEVVAPSGKRRAVRPPDHSSYVAKNFIDDEIFAKMLRDHVAWTIPSSDEQFLRRVTLDLTGQIPTADQVKAFIADTSAGKRDRMIDLLVASDGFVDRWTLWYGDLVQNVQVTANIRESFQGRNAFYNWIRASLQSGKPYDQMVRETLSTSGSAFNAANGPVNYWVRNILTNGPAQDTYDDMSASSGSQFL